MKNKKFQQKKTHAAYARIQIQLYDQEPFYLLFSRDNINMYTLCAPDHVFLFLYRLCANDNEFFIYFCSTVCMHAISNKPREKKHKRTHTKRERETKKHKVTARNTEQL